MPAIYQGTVLRGEGPPILDLANPALDDLVKFLSTLKGSK